MYKVMHREDEYEIAECKTLEEAKRVMDLQEEQDIEDNCYSPKMYYIKEVGK